MIIFDLPTISLQTDGFADAVIRAAAEVEWPDTLFAPCPRSDSPPTPPMFFSEAEFAATWYDAPAAATASNAVGPPRAATDATSPLAEPAEPVAAAYRTPATGVRPPRLARGVTGCNDESPANSASVLASSTQQLYASLLHASDTARTFVLQSAPQTPLDIGHSVCLWYTDDRHTGVQGTIINKVQHANVCTDAVIKCDDEAHLYTLLRIPRFQRTLLPYGPLPMLPAPAPTSARELEPLTDGSCTAPPPSVPWFNAPGLRSEELHA